MRPATDYKALVCVFLYRRQRLRQHRRPLRRPELQRLQRDPRRRRRARPPAAWRSARPSSRPRCSRRPRRCPADVQYALHPAMTELADAVQHRAKLAVQLNVGPLVVPLTRAQYNSTNKKLYPLPPKLFSHNDQQSVWQSSSPEGSTVGWGGSIGDLVLSQQHQLAVHLHLGVGQRGVPRRATRAAVPGEPGRRGAASTA